MQAIGEVLSARISGFVAEAWKSEDGLNLAGQNAEFGSFLKSHSTDRDLTVYAVICEIVTASQDQLHKPIALKMSRSQLRRTQPQIFSLLKTEWHLITIACRESGSKSIRCGLPPHPPELHDFVYPLTGNEISELTEDFDFLQLLMAAPMPLCDELLAAVIRQAAQARQDKRSYLVQAGRHVARILRDDYERLGLLLRRISPQART